MPKQRSSCYCRDAGLSRRKWSCAGISAAVASARCGAKTMLVERYGCFGGALFVGQVESYTWYFNKNTYTAQGISKEIEDRMIKIGGVQDDDRGCGHFLNPEKYKYMLD